MTRRSCLVRSRSARHVSRKKRLKYLLRWRNRTYRLLRKRARLQRKSVHKLQGQIQRGVVSLNKRTTGPTWTFKMGSDLVLAALFRPCIYCRQTIRLGKWSFDHKKPVQRGGTNKERNVQIICSRCNRAKGAVAHKSFKKILNFMRRYPAAHKELLSRLAFGGSFFGRS